MTFCLSHPEIIVKKQSQLMKGAKWDFLIISGTTNIILDVKNRSYDPSDMGFWVEKNKYEALRELANKATKETSQPHIPFMCYITPRAVYFVNLNEITPEWSWTKSWTDSTKKIEQFDLIYTIPPHFNIKIKK